MQTSIRLSSASLLVLGSLRLRSTLLAYFYLCIPMRLTHAWPDSFDHASLPPAAAPLRLPLLPAAAVFLDDLLAEGFRDPANGAKRPDPATAPSIDPRTVRAVKISAEGMDARALHGMRRMLSLGEVPFVLFVFNRDHVRSAGCDAPAMMRAFFASGYRLYHAGVYIYRELELERFLRGVGGGAAGGYARSMELLFVRWGADF